MEELDTLPELKRLNLLPHQFVRRCPKCGLRARRLPRWLMLLLGIDSTAFGIAYCQGGADPEKTISTLFGEAKVRPLCAGVAHEHLHWVCRTCGVTTLTHVRS